jgi:hypothetical protein
MYFLKQAMFCRTTPGIIALITYALLISPASAEVDAALKAGIPIGYKQYHVHYDVNADGTYTESDELAVSVLTDQGILQSKHWQVGMRNSGIGMTRNRDVQLLTAYTLKKNGEHFYVIQPNEGNPSGAAPIIAFPDVEIGDTLVFSYKVTQKEPIIPNQVVLKQFFPKFMAYEDAIISLTAPESLHFRIETVGVGKTKRSSSGHIQRLVWKYQNKKPEAVKDAKSLLRSESTPHIHISTFKDDAAEMEALNKSPVISSPALFPMKDTDLAMSVAVPKLYPRPASEWKVTEKSIYQKLLSGEKFDVLVVPFQVREYALDRPTRSLMTAELAMAVSSGLKMRMPDPFLVERALGEGERRLDQNEVYEFANQLGVKRIVWGYVGHDRNYHMSLRILSQERDAKGVLDLQTKSTAKTFDNIAFTDERPPIEVYQSMMPDILAAIGVDSSALSSPKTQSRLETVNLPSSPLAMVAEKADPARDALYFQLLADLTPGAAERTQERFAEKSYLAILGMAPDSPDYRILKARALMMLGLRPAALQVLGVPQSIEEKELFAMLNGNLPDVEQYSSQIEPGIKKLMATRDANYLDTSYGVADKNKSVDLVTSLKLPGKSWPFLFGREFSGLDEWAQFDNINLKQLLDSDFPIKDYTAEGMIRGAATLGDVGKLQTLADLSVVNHIRKLLEIDAAKWCCQSAIDHPSDLDYLDLIEAIGEDDLMRRAYFLTYVQGVPNRTLEYLNRIESVYKGNPRFVLSLGLAQIQSAKSADGAAKEGLLKSAYNNLFNAFYWEQGQTFYADQAFSYLSSTGRNDYGYFDNFYASDYPYRPYYSAWEHGGDQKSMAANSEAALRNSTSNLKPLEALDWDFTVISNQPDKHDALLKSVEGRFAGNPALYQLFAKNSVKAGDTQSAENYYRESIKWQPNAWQAYMDLGTLLIEQGELDKADKVFKDYPGFKKDSKENPVGISNYAYLAGSRFYWMGEFPLAKPYYEIASRQETGSSGEMTSRLCLDLINGDYRNALLGSLERAQRYNDTHAYRDYLGMLFAMGASKDAWDAFNILANQTNAPYIWESVLVGHHKEGLSDEEIAAWVKQEVAHNTGKNYNLAANYLLRAGITDRTPSQALETNLIEVAQPVWKIDDANGYVVQPSEDGRAQTILGPKTLENSVLPNGVYARAKKSPVKSSLVYFAESYRAIRSGDFASARASLQEASTYYDLSLNESRYLLPYYAFAAAKSGDATAVEKYMADFSLEKRGFDYFLAKAAISGIGGKTDESLQFLKNAFYRRPFTEYRPIQTEYEYAEICEWLYKATGKSEYKKLALDWAKTNQKFLPWFSWAYAMEAELSDNPVERKRAIAMAFYLDPKSERLGRIPEKEREAAVREFKDQNPFLIKDNSSKQAPL